MRVEEPPFTKQTGHVCRQTTSRDFSVHRFHLLPPKRAKPFRMNWEVAGNTTSFGAVWKCSWEFLGSQGNRYKDLTQDASAPCTVIPAYLPNGTKWTLHITLTETRLWSNVPPET